MDDSLINDQTPLLADTGDQSEVVRQDNIVTPGNLKQSADALLLNCDEPPCQIIAIFVVSFDTRTG